MPTDTFNGIDIPTASDAYALTSDLRKMAESTGVIVKVANTTERASVITRMADAGNPVSASNPCTVERLDAPAWERIERTENGSTWYPVNRPLVYRGYRAASGVLADGVTTSIAMDTEQDDPFGIGLAGVVTIPTGGSGLWLISCGAEFAGFNSGFALVQIDINSSAAYYRGDMLPALGGGVSTQLNAHRILRLSAGDVIRARAQQNSGGNLTLNGGSNKTYLHAIRLSA